MSSKFTKRTVLLVPDVHAKAGDLLSRMVAMRDWLEGRQVKLDKIVQIGDLWDFESLCLHDKESPEWYQRSLTADIDAGISGLCLLRDIADDNLLKASDVIFIEGNHEDRYNKWMKSDNRLLTSDFPKTVKALVKDRMPDFGLTFVPFQKPFSYNNIAFCHYFVSGVMNRPVGGERPAANILRSQLMSTVSGHIHTMDYAQRTRADGQRVHSLVAGCFVNPDSPFSYAGAARKLWWNGFHLLHITGPGEFDLESVSLARL